MVNNANNKPAIAVLVFKALAFDRRPPTRKMFTWIILKVNLLFILLFTLQYVLGLVKLLCNMI